MEKTNKKNNQKKQKILALTGGGTMGHISPHLALLDELKKNI